jgi:hypothetical protein
MDLAYIYATLQRKRYIFYVAFTQRARIEGTSCSSVCLFAYFISGTTERISIKFFVIVKGFLLNLILIASSQIELEFFQLLFVKYIFMTLNIDHTEI